MQRAETRELILDIVEIQLRDDDPPETRRTLDRLIGGGTPRDEAIRMIGLVMAAEVNEMVQKGRDFDPRGYSERLRVLPGSPGS